MSDADKIINLAINIVDKSAKVLKGTVANLDKLGKAEDKAVAKSKKLADTWKKQYSNYGKLGKQTKKAVKDLNKLTKQEVKLVKSTKKADKEISQLTKHLYKLSKEKGSITGLTGAFGTLLGTLTSLATPILVFGKFEHTMSAVGAVANATGEELDRLAQKAIDLGSTTSYTSNQVAEGMKFMSMAGFSVKQTYESIGSVLELAKAGSLDLGEAADIATNIMTGFGKSASDLKHVNDVLVTAFTSTNSTLQELGAALAYVGPIASGLGANFEDLVSAVGLLHNAGLKGTMAGTALRSVLDTLFNPTKDEAAQLKLLGDRVGGLGLEITDVTGNFVGFKNIIGQLEKAGITGAEALALFGQRAGPGMSALLSQGSKAIGTLNDQLLDSNGRAKKIAKEMGENLAGGWKKVTSAIEGFLIRVGKKLAPAVTVMEKAIIGFISKLNLWMDINPKLSSSIVGVTAAVIGLVGAFAGLKVAAFSLAVLPEAISTAITGSLTAIGADIVAMFAVAGTTAIGDRKSVV